jgi:Carbohydrate-binding family 9
METPVLMLACRFAGTSGRTKKRAQTVRREQRSIDFSMNARASATLSRRNPFALCRSPHTQLFFGAALLLSGLSCNGCNGYGEGRVIPGQQTAARKTETATAILLSLKEDAEGFPPEQAWESAPAVQFAHDWQGKNSDPQRETTARLLWTPQNLFIKFTARYRTVTVFNDADANGRRDQLWERDVAEIFLQPPEMSGRHYTEFEISPNGFWIDLEIGNPEKRDLQSGLRRRATIDEHKMTWEAVLVLPMRSLTAHFDPQQSWRVNFYRVEGAQEPRFYSAWCPTGTPVPNFHVPESFGSLIFARANR